MKRSNSGFTLVEILIVVIILGILAAIVIPQFTEASQDARNSQLSSDLQMLRSQVELYKVQHLEVSPTTAAQLTSKSNPDGTTTGGTLNLGPYMPKLPTNPFVDPSVGNLLLFGATGTGSATASGWYFNTTTGQVTATDAAHSGL